MDSLKARLVLLLIILLLADSSATVRAGNFAAPNFALAATLNASLKTDLIWTFGGKSQRGWQLYLPLIQQLLQVEEQADHQQFAKAVARWQQSAGLNQSGVLDRETWLTMVAAWQSQRIKSRVTPSAEQLQLVSPNSFYDPTRPDELRQVERRAFQAYQQMIAAALNDASLALDKNKDNSLAASEKFLKIISAFRSPEYQAQLRRQSPNSGRAGLAVNSPHFTGRALDLYVGGEPVSTRDDNRALQTQTRVYRWLVKNAGRFGFQPYFYEPWHWEYVAQ
jgi:LAS superfamily LD-carboxypeptidase LdcB